MAKKSRRRRYSAAEKKKILDTARRENLTGAQVRKRFGIATLTFYRWRGPVRSRRSAGIGASDQATIREEVRSRIRKLVPQVIREEVAAYLAQILGRGPGRPRGSRNRRGRRTRSGKRGGS